MIKTNKYRQLFLSTIAILLYLALIKFLIHMFTGEYGYHRDELFYMTISQNMGLDNLSMLPLAPGVLAINSWVLGDSLKALHFLPALYGAIIVIITGLMAKELGGKRFAVILAAITVIIPPGYLAIDALYTYDAFDKLAWVTAIYILVLIIKRTNPRLWVLFGLIMGIGVLNKITILFLAFAIFVSLLLSPERKYFKNKWIWIGSLLAILFLFPFVYWQMKQGWPIISYGQYYSESKTYPVSLPEFILFQIVVMHPFTFPIWAIGLWYTAFSEHGKKYRLLTIVYLILFVIFVFMKAKPYFLIPVYPFLLVMGSVVIENFIEKRNWRYVKSSIATILILGGGFTAIMSMPVLPVETLVGILNSFGGDNMNIQERHELAELPQHLADRFGWEELAATIAGVYNQLDDEEKSKVYIMTGNYGEAGAIRFFGKQYGLPEPICAHGWHYYQGPGNCTGEIVIYFGIPIKYLQPNFEEIIEAAIFECKYCMPYENNTPVYICRKPKKPFPDIFEDLKHFG